MPRICYTPKKFRKLSYAIIEIANGIITEYAAQGFDLTLRQLYYQFVSRDYIPNSQSEYNRLGSIINDARLAGLIDWESIVDRTRELKKRSTWENPPEIIETCAQQYIIDLWQTQEYRPEVWIEKDALAGVIEGICNQLRVPYFSCRGYTSQSEMWQAAKRAIEYGRGGQIPYIIHLGDHDPSGIDMTRDIKERLAVFTKRVGVPVNRIALNMEQVDEYKPPPNPAKFTDSRCKAYVVEYGTESWELDALEPKVLSNLIKKTVLAIQDAKLWSKALRKEATHKKQLKTISKNYQDIIKGL